MAIYERGWYSLALCANLNIEKFNFSENISSNEDITNKHKLISIEDFVNFKRYKILSETLININRLVSNNKLKKEKLMIFSESFFDHFPKHNLLLFHLSSNKAKSIITFLNKDTISDISLPQNLNLKEYWTKLSTSNFNVKLIEGKFVNVKFSEGSIGKVHLNYIINEDFENFFNQNDSILSWLKINFEFELTEINIEFYFNGTIYIDTIVEMDEIIPFYKILLNHFEG